MPLHTKSRRSSFGSSFNSTSRRRTSYGGNRGYSKPKHGQYIDPARFVKAARPVTIEAYASTHTFADFDVDDKIKQNLISQGFSQPTPIQDQAIPVVLQGMDVIGIANTGTGKTAAFAIPMIHKLLNDKQSKVLIIAPTRELAQQIQEQCRKIGKGTGLYDALLIGGSSMGIQLRDLRSTPRVVIGTPGRISDHINRGTLKLNSFNMVVLDEVDRMLDMGFVADVTEILNNLASERQSLFFSATMDNKVNKLINTFSNDPISITLKTSQSSDNVNQDVIRYGGTSEKLTKLHDLLLQSEVGKAIVFDETQRGVERLSQELANRGFQADAIHGGKSQGQRERALRRFKKNEINVLVATDVAARGIDVSDITHVINYSTPQTYDDYVHRIGRAGRAGKTGHALTFVPR
jgi:superfamily II DNA/RNA helicase